jgi:hypothetical protein
MADARQARAALIPVVLMAGGLALAGCSVIDWERTGQLWLGAACDAASQHCSWDADGDPYTRW